MDQTKAIIYLLLFMDNADSLELKYNDKHRVNNFKAFAQQLENKVYQHWKKQLTEEEQKGLNTSLLAYSELIDRILEKALDPKTKEENLTELLKILEK